MTSQKINKIFELLDTWRNLPAYQLERRADIFFALYLPKIMSKRFGVNAEYIIPEFPVRIGTILNSPKLKNPNLSFKIDYVVVSKTDGKIFFVELKTDDGSRRDKQDWYLEQSKKQGIRSLIDGILEIFKATSSKKKYTNLLELLSEIGFIGLNDKSNICKEYEIEVVYIQPNNDNTNKTIITFDDVAKILKDEDDVLTIRFVQSLLRWKTNPNS